MVPDELRSRPQWLVWHHEKTPTKPDGKPRKVPYYANGRKRTGEQGAKADRLKLVSFDAAVAANNRLDYDGIGFAFLPDDGLIGIDLDNVIDLATGEVSERARKIIAACNSFTEYSPSRTGMHIFVRGQTETFKSNAIGVEVFCNAQYFTFTGEHMSETPQTVNAIDEAVLRRLRATVDEAKGKRKQPAAARAQAAPAAVPIGDDFQRVNDAAIRSLDAWVPGLFPGARRSAKGYRVASADLGRELEEDLSITTDGIVDFGVADMGDAREGRRTPIDLVIEWGKAASSKDALHWLAAQLGVTLSKPAGRGAGASGNAPTPDEGNAGGNPRDDDLPLIRWRQGFLPYAVNSAEEALMGSSERIYQRSGFLVRVLRRDTPSVRNYQRQPGSLGVYPIDTPYLVEAFTRCARWEKWDVKSGKWRRMNAPEQAATTYLSRVGRWKVPRLWSVISAPTLRPDGTMLQTPGYDAATQTWYDPGDAKFPQIPENPTQEDSRYALEQLREAFGTFPFDSSVDESVYLSLVLTALVRRSLPAAPLGAITAPVMASGKTLLADCIAILATGAVAPAMKFADSDEEAAKTALAVLAEGDQVVLIDNVERPLQGDWLCSILTNESYRQRVLGMSKMLTAPTTTLFLATGNHLVIAGDLRTRSLLCRLDPKCEHPEQREYPYDLRERIATDRARLVTAGLTVMRGFIDAKERDKDVARFVKAFGRFEHWSEMVRAPLLWLGVRDPCESVAAIEADDPQRGEHIQMLHAWKKLFAEEEQGAAEVIKSVSGLPHELTTEQRDFLEVLRPIASDRQKNLSSRRLGHWLRQHTKRRVEGMQFLKTGERDHTAVWRLEVLKDSGVAPAAPGGVAGEEARL